MDIINESNIDYKARKPIAHATSMQGYMSYTEVAVCDGDFIRYHEFFDRKDDRNPSLIKVEKITKEEAKAFICFIKEPEEIIPNDTVLRIDDPVLFESLFH